MVIEAPIKNADPRYAVTSYDFKITKLVAPGLVVIDRPDRVWAMDITYIPMARGFVYLAVVLD